MFAATELSEFWKEYEVQLVAKERALKRVIDLEYALSEAMSQAAFYCPEEQLAQLMRDLAPCRKALG